MHTIMLVKTNLVIDQYNALHNIIQTSIASYYLEKKKLIILHEIQTHSYDIYIEDKLL